MRQLVAVVLLSIFIYQLAFGRIIIRTKRQIEREGNYGNESTIIVNGDRKPTDFDVSESENGKKDVMEVDFNQDDGTFSFGGQFPSFFHRNVHNGFDSLFRQMTQRFEEMARNMYQRFNNTSSQYPANYNGTKEEIITVEGRQYIKKEHVIKKSENNINIFLTSTTYEPIDDRKNES